MAFTGFSKDAMQFLVDLALNNERSWFQPRKAEVMAAAVPGSAVQEYSVR